MNYILISAIIPIVFEFVLLLVFVFRFDTNLNKLNRTFKLLSDHAADIDSSDKYNILYLNEFLDKKTPKFFMEKWEYMKNQIENQNHGAFIPEANTFFPYNELVISYCGKNRTKDLWRYFFVLETMSLVFPIITSMFFNIDINNITVVFILGSFSLIAVMQILFMLIFESGLHRVDKQYNRFIFNFNKIAPVADKNTVLIINKISESQNTVEESTKRIVNKFDGFAEEIILPALKDSLNIISAAQENGMKRLASEFTNNLTNIVETRMISLSKTISTVETNLTKLNGNLSDNVSGINNLLIAQRKVLEEAAERLIVSAQAQMKTTIKIQEMQKQAIDNREELNTQIQKMSESIELLKEQNDVFAVYSSNMIKKTTEIHQQINDQLSANQNNINGSIKKSEELMDSVVSNIKTSMTDAGKEIANSIKETTADNAEAIEKITEQAKLLREDYDNYFNRIEEYSRTANEEMEFHVHNIISKISEEVENLLSESLKINQSILEDYKNSSSGLLITFKEQADSISLHATEINMDVNELSESLKSSVSTFSQSVQDSVVSTMSEFDIGLAELTKRIANTVESICDAVEALPAAIEKK